MCPLGWIVYGVPADILVQTWFHTAILITQYMVYITSEPVGQHVFWRSNQMPSGYSLIPLQGGMKAGRAFAKIPITGPNRFQ